MADNVIIFGAGASVDAGIPTLSNFLKCMKTIVDRKSHDETSIDKSKLEILEDAIKIRDEFGVYHKNANFDDNNIEDILSLLSFEKLAGNQKADENYKKFVDAIALTIEITNSVKYNYDENYGKYDQNNLYNSFWIYYFDKFSTANLPAIITFNYDLVLENSLLRYFFSEKFKETNKSRLNAFYIDYGFDKFKTKIFNINKGGNYGNNDFGTSDELGIKEIKDIKGIVAQKYFKLHGSLNFPTDYSNIPYLEIHKVHNSPLIMPPIFNKMNDKFPSEIWENAIKELRSAKNIIIVGYSLPSTDIYMQYFFKSAFGASTALDKITIYNPTLLSDASISGEMKTRYSNCFSGQLFSKIDFNPILENQNLESIQLEFKKGNKEYGTFLNFVNHLRQKKDLFF